MNLVLLLLVTARALAGEVYRGMEICVGDPHAHTGLSGDGASADLQRGCAACGSLDGLLDFAAARGLDWVAVSDHVNGGATMDADGWLRLRDVLARPSPVTVVPAAELALAWIGGEPVGHRNLMLFGDEAQLRGITLDEVRPFGEEIYVDQCDDLAAWMQRLTATRGPALLIPHHPAVRLPSVTDWDCFAPAWSPVVEVYSSHGNSLDEARGYDLSPFLEPSALVQTAMAPEGPALRMGFLAGSDRHDTRPGDTCSPLRFQTRQPYLGGLTLALVPEGEGCTRAALYEALLARRTVASTGPAVPVSVVWRQDASVLAGLGDPVNVHDDADLALDVNVPGGWSRFVAEVVAVTPDGEVPLVPYGAGWSASWPAGAAPAWAYAALRLVGTQREGCADGGADTDEWLWVSPSWIQEVGADLDGDGHAWREDCDDHDARVHPGAVDAPYDGLDADCLGDDDADRDGDGAPWPDDCDDHDPGVRPGVGDASCDGRDEDCDGVVDEDADTLASYLDEDGDGFGVAGTRVDTCARPSGWVDRAGDCDDGASAVHPGAVDASGDGVDADCDGSEGDVADGHGCGGSRPFPALALVALATLAGASRRRSTSRGVGVG